MDDLIEELRRYSKRKFWGGVSYGVTLCTITAGGFDSIDKSLDHPWELGVPLAVSILFDVYNSIRYGEDLGLNRLETKMNYVSDLYHDLLKPKKSR